MKETEVIELLSEVMELEDDLELNSILENYEEWDSLTLLSLTVVLKKDYDIILTTEDITKFVTVSDVLDFINEKMK